MGSAESAENSLEFVSPSTVGAEKNYTFIILISRGRSVTLSTFIKAPPTFKA